MPKFDNACYFENEQWNTVSYKELTDANKRAVLREKELFDSQNSNKILGIRNHQKTPHFYQKQTLRGNIETGIKETEEHTKQINIIKSFLTKNEKNAFGFYESPWEKDYKNKGFDFIIKTKEYKWDKEVKFGLIYGKYIVFDILGRSNALSLTENNPYIAIEVVDTHFHSKETFKVLLELSKNMPFIVLYFFVQQIPYINSTKKPERTNSFTHNRIRYYISDGSFWDCNDRIEDDGTCTIQPTTPDEYYNYIIDKLNADNLIKR